MKKFKFVSGKVNRINRLAVSSLAALLMIMFHCATINAQAKAAEPSAKLERIWIDYDVTEGGVKGMRIHTKFTVYEMKNVPSYMAIYFETGDGKRLRDKNKNIYSSTGDVALYKELQIDYNPGVYGDLAMFMPYDELDLEPGEYNLRMDVDLIYKAGGLIQHLTFEKFDYTKPAAEKSEATVEKVWVDYDITENGKRGMRIHVNFTVRGLKGVDSYQSIYFQHKDDEKLTNTNTAYSSKDGQLAVYKSLKPGYEPTVYEDAQLFLPYEEIKLGKGIFDLKMDLDLIYKNGDLFQHLDFHEFEFRRGQ